MRSHVVALLLASAAAMFAASKIAVTVIDEKSGQIIKDLKVEDFEVLDDKTPKNVQSAEFDTTDSLDVMLLLDTSLLGEAVFPIADGLIDQLGEKDQMAVVSFDSSAELIQEFTSSKDLLRGSLSRVKFGNPPRVLDAVYAALRDGFDNAPSRRVILLATTGVEGPSRVGIREVLRLARRKGVSVYPVFVSGYDRDLFRDLARGSGGAPFNLRDMSRRKVAAPGVVIFEVVRSRYLLTVPGNLALGEKVTVKLRPKGKFLVSALPLE